jgi:hypothetical protein
MTLANAPLLGQDGGSCRSDLPDGLSEIFFQTGLDRANQLDPAQQIRLRAHAPQRLSARKIPDISASSELFRGLRVVVALCRHSAFRFHVL